MNILAATPNYHSYILLGIVCAITALVFVFQSNRSIMTKAQALYLRMVLVGYIGYCVSNVFWGFVEGGMMPGGIWANKILNFFSYFFFTGLIFFWCCFLCERFLPILLDKKWEKAVIALPMLVVVGLDLASIWTGWFYSFSEEGVYSVGEYFFAIAAVDVIYVLIGTAACFYQLIRSHSRKSRWTNLVLLSFGPIGIVATILQSTVLSSEPVAMGSMLVLMAVLLLSLRDDRIYNDALTGLNNRRRLDEYIRDLIPQTNKEKSFVLMIFDVDKFKKINDTHGHIIGDRTLKVVSRAFFVVVRTTGGFVARYGGDEFVMIFPNKNIDCEQIVSDLNKAVEELAKADGGLDFPIRLSGGSAVFSDPREKAESIIQRADQSLYEAKRKNRETA